MSTIKTAQLNGKQTRCERGHPSREDSSSDEPWMESEMPLWRRRTYTNEVNGSRN